MERKTQREKLNQEYKYSIHLAPVSRQSEKGDSEKGDRFTFFRFAKLKTSME